jgi:photosystem II stability/assembly factor-like uncharacterized protein
MSDLDRFVTQLRQDVAHSPWPEPHEMRSRGARRSAGQVLAGIAAAIIIVAAGSVGAYAIAHRTDRGLPPAGTATESPSASAPSASATAQPSTAEPEGTVVGILPPGSTVDDLTFVSATHGWLLASAPCPKGTCATIVHTIDGGHTWTTLPAPPSDVPLGQPGVPGAGLRFANDLVGYLYSPLSATFYLTRDGGSTWAQQTGPIDAIEVANGTALRITSTVPECVPGCAYQILRAPVASGQWTTVATPSHAGTVQLLRTGHRAFAALYGNTASGASNQYAQLLTSADDGATWTTRPDPCGTGQGAESVSTRMAVADDGSMTMLCYVRGGNNGPTFVVTSTDGGATFGPRRPTPGPGLTVGAASASILFVSTIDGTTLHLYRSSDGGATWTVSATAPEQIGQGAVPDGEAGFQNAHDGWWLPGRGTVFDTTDAGRTWVAYQLAG